MNLVFYGGRCSPGANTPMPRRVLILAWAPFFSGAERALLMTVRHLDPSRYAPHVVVGTDGELLAELRKAGISSEYVRFAWLDRRHLPSWAASVARVTRICRRLRPCVVHANDVQSFQPGGYAARLLGLPGITHVRFPNEGPGYRWFLRPGFSRAVFVSQSFMADTVAVAPDVFSGRAEVIYDGVLVPPQLEEAARLDLRHRLGLPLDRTLVAIVGQIAEVKGIWEFVHAAGHVTRTMTTAHFVVVGDDLQGGGALTGQMRKTVAALGLTSRFSFLGFQRAASTLMPAFDIIAAPSHLEPLGLSVLEGMAAGRPVVGAGVGGMLETIDHETTGLLVPPRDAEALGAALAALISSPQRRREMGVAGRARVRAMFSVERNGEAVQDLYDRVCSGPV